MSDDLEKLLASVEADAVMLKMYFPELDDLKGTSTWALKLVRRIRAGDMMAAVQLGQNLETFSGVMDTARSRAKYENAVINRKHSTADQRRKAYDAARARGLSITAAYEWAAQHCGVNAKTIKRAVKR